MTTLTALLMDAGGDLLGADAAVTVLAPDSTTAATDERLRQAEAAAQATGGGPAHACMRDRAPLPPLRLDDANTPWPGYTALGYTWLTALPLEADGEVLGALALFGTGVPPDDDLLALGRSLAEAAALSLLREREAAATRTLAAQLEHALASRVVIEQAKGVLAAKLSVPVTEAFALLRRHARSQRRRLPDVAHDVVSGHDLPPAQVRQQGRP
jgi:hypothetical protein